MPYGLMVTVPAAPIQAYEALHAEILREQGPSPVDGLVVHFARATDAGFQVVEVWESKEASELFARRVVNPVVDRVSAGQPAPPGPPVVEEFEVHGLMSRGLPVPAPRAADATVSRSG